MLFAAGAVVLESALDGKDGGWSRLRWLKPAIVLLLLASGAYLAPIVVPVLSPIISSRTQNLSGSNFP